MNRANVIGPRARSRPGCARRARVAARIGRVVGGRVAGRPGHRRRAAGSRGRCELGREGEPEPGSHERVAAQSDRERCDQAASVSRAATGRESGRRAGGPKRSGPPRRARPIPPRRTGEQGGRGCRSGRLGEAVDEHPSVGAVPVEHEAQHRRRGAGRSPGSSETAMTLSPRSSTRALIRHAVRARAAQGQPRRAGPR